MRGHPQTAKRTYRRTRPVASRSSPRLPRGSYPYRARATLSVRPRVGLIRRLPCRFGPDRDRPDFGTHYRCRKTLAVGIPRCGARGPLNPRISIKPVTATGSREAARGNKGTGMVEANTCKPGGQKRPPPGGASRTGGVCLHDHEWLHRVRHIRRDGGGTGLSGARGNPALGRPAQRNRRQVILLPHSKRKQRAGRGESHLSVASPGKTADYQAKTGWSSTSQGQCGCPGSRLWTTTGIS